MLVFAVLAWVSSVALLIWHVNIKHKSCRKKNLGAIERDVKCLSIEIIAAVKVTRSPESHYSKLGTLKSPLRRIKRIDVLTCAVLASIKSYSLSRKLAMD